MDDCCCFDTPIADSNLNGIASLNADGFISLQSSAYHRNVLSYMLRLVVHYVVYIHSNTGMRELSYFLFAIRIIGHFALVGIFVVMISFPSIQACTSCLMLTCL